MLPPPRILVLIGSNTAHSALHTVVSGLVQSLESLECAVDVWDLHQQPLALLDPATTYTHEDYTKLKPRVEAADVFIAASPDYHGGMSGTLKNALDHFWQEYAGKLFVPLVTSYDKGLTAIDQIRTVARQCYAWSLPYGFSVAPKTEVAEGACTAELKTRLQMLAHDVRTYGALIADQRRADMSENRPGFMARYRLS